MGTWMILIPSHKSSLYFGVCLKIAVKTKRPTDWSFYIVLPGRLCIKPILLVTSGEERKEPRLGVGSM